MILYPLICPKCKEPFARQNDKQVSCANNHIYLIDEKVLCLETRFKVDEKYNWGKKLRDPRENLKLDTTQSALANVSNKARAENMTCFVLNNIPRKNNILLDIVTGRGLLMRKLMPFLEKTAIFLNDISADVLVGTSKLLEPLRGTNAIIPIQTSATNLPFPDNSLSLIVSFGPNNAIPCETSFREIYRILRKGGYFVFSISLLEKNSPSYDYLLKEKEMSPFSVINDWEREMDNIGYKIFKKEKLFDGPVKKIPLDLIPREDGERFQDVGVVATK